MPVDFKPYAKAMPTQREQYKKSLLTKLYRDFADKKMIRYVSGTDSILDIGCGEGIILEKLTNSLLSVRHLLGIDRSTENVRICKGHSLSVIHADCYELCFKNNSIDCCILSDVFEHLENPQDAMHEIRRVLKKGGRLIIQIPNDTFSKLINFLIVRRRYDFTAGHLRQWTPKEIRRELFNMGFKVIKEFNMPAYFWPISFHYLAVACKQ